MEFKKTLLAGAVSSVIALAGCSSSGGGSEETDSEGTTISGTVSLSGIVTGKPQAKAPYGKPGSRDYKTQLQQLNKGGSLLLSEPPFKAFANSEVFLYSADHPEWEGPVANTTTDANGDYTLSALSGAAENGNAYVDGDPIPEGNYTLIASDYDPTLGAIVVAIQNVAQDFQGDVSGNNLEAVPSDVVPRVDLIVGQSKNTDGTQTWGSSTVELSPNSAIQVTFSMPMARETVTAGGVQITTAGGVAVDGTWEISPDWMTATFHPASEIGLDPSTEYLITVKGDDTYKTSAVKNVYGNRLALTATGTFMTGAAEDTTAPAPSFSPSGTGVDAAASLTLSSDELLDTSRLTLSLTPSLGKKPLVSYQGVEGTSHVYELITAEPLAAGTSYTGSISDVTDLAGNAPAQDISVSFSTVSGTVAGVTVSSDDSVATVQTAAANLFQKWIDAMNDRDLAKWQGLTAGQFAMDYSLAEGFDGEIDTNRDGSYSLDEFSNMLQNFAFPMWEQCGTTLTGTVVGDINADAGNEKADFEFKLTGTSTEGGQNCSDATPDESLYAVVRKISGIWKVEHASEGIDTRNTTGGQISAMKLTGPATDAVMLDDPMGPPTFRDEVVNDNGTPDDTADDTVFAAAGDPLKFGWNAVDGASSYVFIVMDTNEPGRGFALAMPADKTTLDFADPCSMPDEGSGCTSPNVEISKEFGFYDEFRPRPGSALTWQIAALGSNTVDMIKNDRNSSLAKDVMAISKTRRVLIDGVARDINIAVKDAMDIDVPFSEIYNGYNLSAAGVTNSEGFVDVTITTESFTDIDDPGVTNGMGSQSDNQGFLRIEGAFRNEFQLDFDPDTNADVVAGTVTRNDLDGNPVTLYTYSVTQNVQLSKGNNWAEVMDAIQFGADPWDWWESENTLRTHFGFQTDQGLDPLVSIGDIFDDMDSATAINATTNPWNEYTANSGATAVTISGTVNSEWTANEGLNVNLWNEELQVNKHVNIPVNGSGSYSVTLDIYHGRNWINVDGQVCNNITMECSWATSHMGVETDTGAVYVPPISITGMMDSVDSTIVIDPLETFGDYARYDASAASSDTVVISGSMVNFNDPQDTNNRPEYGAGGEGGWTGGTLNVNADGTFELTVELFNGFNNVHFRDVNDNWYNMEIYTSNGKPVIKPVIDTINGLAYTAPDGGGMGQFSTDQCSVTISGTAKKGEVMAFWRGEYDGGTPTDYSDDEFYYEEQSVLADEANPVVVDGVTVYPFTVTLPVINDGARNFIDINDSSWNWTGLEATTTGACAYTAPVMEVTDVTNPADGTTLTPTIGAGSVQVDASTLEAIDVMGTSTRPGASIKLEMNACGARDVYTTTADTIANGNGKYPWIISSVMVYDGSMYANLSDGANWWSMDVGANNGVQPVPPVAVSGVEMRSESGVLGTDAGAAISNSCGYAEWDVSSASYVLITGTSNSPEEQHLAFADGEPVTFTPAADGSFEVEVKVYQDYNNIWIEDPSHSGFGIGVFVASGDPRPQYVEMTSPLNGATGVSGSTAITATIYRDAKDNSAATEFKPDWVDMEVCQDNGNGEMCNYYNLDDGSLSMVDNGDGTWSVTVNEDILVEFDHDNDPNTAVIENQVRVNVWASGSSGGHGVEAWINPTSGQTGHYWKPASKQPKKPARMLRQMINSTSKYWNMQ